SKRATRTQPPLRNRLSKDSKRTGMAAASHIRNRHQRNDRVVHEQSDLAQEGTGPTRRGGLCAGAHANGTGYRLALHNRLDVGMATALACRIALKQDGSACQQFHKRNILRSYSFYVRFSWQ